VTSEQELAERLYRAYEADKALVMADPELEEAEMTQAITELTDALIRKEERLGICYQPLSSVHVENATTSGIVKLTREETNK
jgi:hypothetical protein